MLDPKTFICSRCGECCIKYIVKLSKADIEKIKKKGYSEEDFVDIDKNLPGPTKFVLRKRDDYSCVFLVKNKEGISSCKIYGSRPSVCIQYPFLKKNVETCKPVAFSN
ncbi:MAG: YkgJ family cysteine cluster protein [Nanoarchaeota archaeon]|nr:YkgJ family cysteine cluster protein [Nanoarchaeota archaeon]MBU1005019.1 YkgJ family cysteine cluster protein [Nanoarchaeota archaeon]MBU1945911.1 YkgJ family cysteine cluster protein [Nanoarchaeota archaeon]